MRVVVPLSATAAGAAAASALLFSHPCVRAYVRPSVYLYLYVTVDDVSAYFLLSFWTFGFSAASILKRSA